MSAFAVASRLVYPSTFFILNSSLILFAVFCAFMAYRDPMRVWTPAFANRAAMALPSLPVPPIMASEGLGFDIFCSSGWLLHACVFIFFMGDAKGIRILFL